MYISRSANFVTFCVVFVLIQLLLLSSVNAVNSAEAKVIGKAFQYVIDRTFRKSYSWEEFQSKHIIKQQLENPVITLEEARQLTHKKDLASRKDDQAIMDRYLGLRVLHDKNIQELWNLATKHTVNGTEYAYEGVSIPKIAGLLAVGGIIYSATSITLGSWDPTEWRWPDSKNTLPQSPQVQAEEQGN